jgi:hypothetical protein
MKAITANRLTDGKVVYWTESGFWSEDLHAAARLSAETSETAFEQANKDQLLVVGPYLMDLDEAGTAPGGRKHVRETIRLTGPSAGTTQGDRLVSV